MNFWSQVKKNDKNFDQQYMNTCPFILIFLPLLTFAQTDNLKLVDSLKYVTDMPYMCESEMPYDAGCGSRIFWKIVQQKEAVIPFLIEKMADTTTTEAYVPNFGGQHTVGDIAYHALGEIIAEIPTFKLLGVKFDTRGCGYCAYWNYLRSNIENRIKFQAAVREWYRKNKSNLIWVPNGEPLTPLKYHNGGMFHLKK